MSKVKKALTSFIAIMSLVGLLPQQVFADTLGDITTYSVKSGNNLVETTDAVWSTSDKLLKFDKTSHTVTEFNTLTGGEQLTLGRDGTLWLAHTTSQGAPIISQIDQNGNTLKTHNLTSNTGVYGTLAAASDGKIWYPSVKTLGPDPNNPYGSIQQSTIIRLNSNGTIHQEINVGSSHASTATDHTYSKVKADLARELVWDTPISQVYNYSLGRAVTTSYIGKTDMNGTRAEEAIPFAKSSYVTSTIMGPDGNLWFLAKSDDETATYVGFVDNNWNFTISKLPSSTQNGMAFSITAGKDGNLWIVHGVPGGWNYLKLSRVEPSSIGGSEIDDQDFYTVPNYNAKYAILGGTNGSIWASEGSQFRSIGTGVTPSSSTIDLDEDGVTLDHETTQGTQDDNPDSDFDGINDFTESQWLPSRDDIFCNSNQTTCEYPNPTEKDIYTEVDWMTHPAQGANSSYEMKPSSSEVQAVVDAFDAKDIHAHFDTGQLGGGNEVAFQDDLPITPTENARDFYDYKKGGDSVSTPQFNQNRERIYHYMISGYNYLEVPASSGGALAGDDDLFLSYGLIKDGNQSNFSTAISGSVMHELGHNLCLTNGEVEAYPGQPEECRFDGIHAHAGNDYPSVMNYDKQFDLVDYSTGANGVPNDHDDWAALQLRDFINSNRGDIEHGQLVKLNKKFKGNRSGLLKSAEYKKLLKATQRIKATIQHNH